MWRRPVLLVLGAVLCSMAAAQEPISGYEIYEGIRSHSGGWYNLAAAGGGSFQVRGVTVSYPATVRVAAIGKLKATPGSLEKFCQHSVGLGVGLCADENRPMPHVFFNWGIDAGVKQVPNSNPARYQRIWTQSNGTSGTHGSHDSMELAVAAWNVSAYQSAANHIDTRTASWIFPVNHPRLADPEGPSTGSANSYLVAALAEGMWLLKPSVTEWTTLYGVVVQGDYLDAGWCAPEDNCVSLDEPVTDPGTGTDWQEGLHKTRCDGAGELNIFEKALFFAFEPCQDWPAAFLSASDGAADRFPFALKGWITFNYGAGSGNYGAVEWNVSTADIDAADGGQLNTAAMETGNYSPEEIAWQSRPGFRVTIPAMEFGLLEIPEVVFNPLDNVVGRWYVNVGRAWMFYFLVASFYLAIFYRIVR